MIWYAATMGFFLFILSYSIYCKLLERVFSLTTQLTNNEENRLVVWLTSTAFVAVSTAAITGLLLFYGIYRLIFS